MEYYNDGIDFSDETEKTSFYRRRPPEDATHSGRLDAMMKATASCVACLLAGRGAGPISRKVMKKVMAQALPMAAKMIETDRKFAGSAPCGISPELKRQLMRFAAPIVVHLITVGALETVSESKMS